MLQARAKEWRARFLALTARRPRLLFWGGLALTLWLALPLNGRAIVMSPRDVEAALSRKDDIPNLYHAASRATWRDIPKWWVGPWIYPDVGYYRPLTSMLYFFENRAFDKNFTAYNRVTLLMHGLNAALLYLLTVSLFRHHPRARYLLGLCAVYYFATRANSLYFGVAKALSWWPAQNDVLSLLFGLLSLVLLERYLEKARPAALVGALLAYAASIGSKEMGFIILPIALAILWHRKRRLTGAMAAFVVLTAALWIFRRIVVPNAWGPVMERAVIVHKAMFEWSGTIYSLVRAGIWWPVVAGAAITLLVAVGLRRHWPVYRIAALSLLTAGLCAQFIGEDGTWGLLLDEQSEIRLWEVLIFLLGIALFWRFRRVEPGLLVGGALLLVYVPILQYGGWHYFYWPGAFLGLVNATFFACLWHWAQELRAGANWSLPSSLLPAKKQYQSE